MTQSKSGSITTAERDLAVGKYEKILRKTPDNVIAVKNLSTILDWYLPSTRKLGAYTDCQRLFSSKFQEDTWIDDVLNPGKAAEHYKKWKTVLDSMKVKTRVPVTQLHCGKHISIHETPAYCELKLSLFKKEGVIPRICHDCFKVQILTLDVSALIQVYFVLRALKLPRDNSRKCMVELREEIPFPYKGYIYCESEDEVAECLSEFQQTLNSLEISNVYCGITHGCSEYGLKHPDFKYSEDGAYRSFERPEIWDQSEAEFWSVTKKPRPGRKDHNKDSITVRDMIALGTWLDYAEIIGDDSSKMFRDPPSTNKLNKFAERVGKQSQLRKTQMEELRQRLSSTA